MPHFAPARNPLFILTALLWLHHAHANWDLDLSTYSPCGKFYPSSNFTGGRVLLHQHEQIPDISSLINLEDKSNQLIGSVRVEPGCTFKLWERTKVRGRYVSVQQSYKTLSSEFPPKSLSCSCYKVSFQNVSNL